MRQYSEQNVFRPPISSCISFGILGLILQLVNFDIVLRAT